MCAHVAVPHGHACSLGVAKPVEFWVYGYIYIYIYIWTLPVIHEMNSEEWECGDDYLALICVFVSVE
jgi:hypothetical protein